MCSAFFTFKTRSELLFLLAFNRDEYFDRPTSAAHFWDEDQELLAGQDLERKGTWLGVTRQARFAFLTNFREPESKQSQTAPSRGELAAGFLQGTSSPVQYLLELVAADYNGFNLVVGDISTGELAYMTNRDEDGPIKMVPGTYGISNGTLNSAWPKVFCGRDALQALEDEGKLAGPDVPWEDVFAHVLGSQSQVTDDNQLPRTGLPLEQERQMSPVFLEAGQLPGGLYGTRSQTVLAIFQDGHCEFRERTRHASGSYDEAVHRFEVDLSRRSSRDLAQSRASSKRNSLDASEARQISADRTALRGRHPELAAGHAGSGVLTGEGQLREYISI